MLLTNNELLNINGGCIAIVFTRVGFIFKSIVRLLRR